MAAAHASGVDKTGDELRKRNVANKPVDVSATAKELIEKEKSKVKVRVGFNQEVADTRRITD